MKKKNKEPVWPILLGAAIVVTMLLMSQAHAGLEDMDSLIETSCEINTFSQMRLEDNYRHTYPPKWLDKTYVQRRVDACVYKFKEENKDLLK